MKIYCRENQMDRFSEVLKHAIGLEEEAASLYQYLASKAERPELKKVFEEVRAQEEGHKKRLEAVLAKQQLPQTKKYTPDEDLKLAEYLVDVDPHKPNLSYEEALIVGMKLEKASLDLYRRLADDADDAELKALFNFLADEEAKHKYGFESRYDDLI
ncbi:MAG: ferritin family protein [bacterium]|nr:ferritin family protein [bacterium]